MFHVKDDKQPYIFDQFGHLGPKRRRLLDESWVEVFRSEILPELPIDELRKHYHETMIPRPVTRQIVSPVANLPSVQSF